LLCTLNHRYIQFLSFYYPQNIDKSQTKEQLARDGRYQQGSSICSYSCPKWNTQNTFRCLSPNWNDTEPCYRDVPVGGILSLDRRGVSARRVDGLAMIGSADDRVIGRFTAAAAAAAAALTQRRTTIATEKSINDWCTVLLLSLGCCITLFIFNGTEARFLLKGFRLSLQLIHVALGPHFENDLLLYYLPVPTL